MNKRLRPSSLALADCGGHATAAGNRRRRPQHALGGGLLPSGELLITERGGTMRTAKPGTKPSSPIKGIPALAVQGQGGLLDVVLDSDFARNRTLFCFSEPGDANRPTAPPWRAPSSARDNKRLSELRRSSSQKPGGQPAHF